MASSLSMDVDPPSPYSPKQQRHQHQHQHQHHQDVDEHFDEDCGVVLDALQAALARESCELETLGHPRDGTFWKTVKRRVILRIQPVRNLFVAANRRLTHAQLQAVTFALTKFIVSVRSRAPNYVPGWIHSDDMGLGKTLAMVAFGLSILSRYDDDFEAAELGRRSSNENGGNTVVVFVPLSTWEDWCKDLRRVGDGGDPLRCGFVKDVGRTKKAASNGGARAVFAPTTEFLLVSTELLKHPTAMAWSEGKCFRAIAIDEGTPSRTDAR